MTVNASNCRGRALLNSHALHRNSVKDKSAALAAETMAIRSCFNALIVSDLHPLKAGANSTRAISLPDDIY
jgi:hypothetical protein